jgi:hypothetical protein
LRVNALLTEGQFSRIFSRLKVEKIVEMSYMRNASLCWVVYVKSFVSAAWAAAIGLSASVLLFFSLTLEVQMVAHADMRMELLAVLWRAFLWPASSQLKQTWQRQFSREYRKGA